MKNHPETGFHGRSLAGVVSLSMLAVSLVLAPLAAHADRVSFAPMDRGGAALTRYAPQQLDLTPVRPPVVKRLPKNVVSPYFATIRLGPREQPSVFTVLVDAPEGRSSRIFVDANGNGDFLDDPAPTWTHKEYAGRESDHLLVSVGSATLQVRFGKQIVPMRVTLSRYDTTEPARAPQFLPLTCTADYAREGSLVLGDKPYHAWLVDVLTRGDFRGSGKRGQSGVFLLIDVNHNGKIDARGETYDATEPFNIGGTTYELRDIDPTGLRADLVKSPLKVAEVLPPPDLSVGKLVVPFEATATDGQQVHFPSDYKKRLVLLYFWATWCGDCQRDVPYVAAAFKEFHGAGLEILGISLDKANDGPKLASFTKEHAMPWQEVYDGKEWNAAIAQLYFITSTPTALLVDGDTGAILANGQDLSGDRLAPTIARHLPKR